MKQWELKNNSKVQLSNGQMVTFIKMDGMYANWQVGKEFLIGNFDEFEETEFGYKEVDKKESYATKQ